MRGAIYHYFYRIMRAQQTFSHPAHGCKTRKERPADS